MPKDGAASMARSLEGFLRGISTLWGRKKDGLPQPSSPRGLPSETIKVGGVGRAYRCLLMLC